MFEIADIFRKHYPEYFRRYNAPPEIRRAVYDIMKCCTPEMGRSILCTCPKCGYREIRYQSCGNRNCPKCGHHKIAVWVNKRMKEKLPVDYFMVTFTLPHEFNIVFQRNPEEAVKIFFRAVSASLLEMGLARLHGTVGLMMIYQSWCRNGDFHPHIHVLMPGGALSPDRQTWYFPRKHKFIFHWRPLARKFRKKFNDMIQTLAEAEMVEQAAFFKNYVVNIKNVGDGVNSFNYLAAYTQRGFLANGRIVDYDGENVTFSYRENAEDGSPPIMRTRTLPTVEFMQLYLQHVLPKGVQRIRYGGIWAAAARKMLAAAKEILSSIPAYAAELTRLAQVAFLPPSPYLCPKCKTVMQHGFCTEAGIDSG